MLRRSGGMTMAGRILCVPVLTGALAPLSSRAVEGSKFDTSNNKHLFYWFFEKRAKSLLPAEERPKVGAAFDWPWSKKKEAPAPAEPAADKQAEAPANEEIPLVIWLTGGPGWCVDHPIGGIRRGRSWRRDDSDDNLPPPFSLFPPRCFESALPR